MSSKAFNPQTAILLVFILATAAIRVILNMNYDVTVLANYSPVGAMALFGGAYFNRKWKATAFPFLVLFISDFVLHQTVFRKYGNGFLYSGWYWVYGAFLLMVVIGRWLLNKVTLRNFVLGVFTCVFTHWIVTDIGVWIGSTAYPQNAGGFIDCLDKAIPFEWRFLAGTAAYGAVLFGVYEWMKHAQMKQQYAQGL